MCQANIKWHRTHRLTHICVYVFHVSLSLFMSVAILFQCSAIVPLPLSWLLIRRNFSIHYKCNNKTHNWTSLDLSLSLSFVASTSHPQDVAFLWGNYFINMWQSANKRSSLSTATMKFILIQAKSVYATRTHFTSNWFESLNMKPVFKLSHLGAHFIVTTMFVSWV